MSSTRRADPDAPLSQERYMSSPEFAELNPIVGTAVAKRVSVLKDAAERELILFVQGWSVQIGSPEALASELLAMFPERVGTRTMHKLGDARKQYTSAEACEIEAEMDISGDCTAEYLRREYYDVGQLLDDYEESPEILIPSGSPVPRQKLYDQCLEVARAKLPEYLVEVCINPRVRLAGSVFYFRDVAGTLAEYKRGFEEKARAEFCQTAISRKIWAALEKALATKTMVMVDGLEGRGKTEAVLAWCKCHLGSARFVSLKGTSTKTSQFRELARPLGVGHSNSRKVSEMQCSVEEVLRLSGLMPVIDEAHFFFNQGPRMYTRPEMLDWIDTALCNPALPVALITTPQFMQCLARAAGQTGWNYKQFRRRCKSYVALPAKNTPKDIEAVARHLLPDADKASIMVILAHEALSKQDLSAVGDVVREAKELAKAEGSKRVTYQHVSKAVNDELTPSALPWKEAEKQIEQFTAQRVRAEQRRGRKLAVEMSAMELQAARALPSAPDRPQATETQAAHGRNRIRFSGLEAPVAAEVT